MKYNSLILFLSLLILVSGCATKLYAVSDDKVLGFLFGMLNGFGMLHSFTASITAFMLYPIQVVGMTLVI